MYVLKQLSKVETVNFTTSSWVYLSSISVWKSWDSSHLQWFCVGGGASFSFFDGLFTDQRSQTPTYYHMPGRCTAWPHTPTSVKNGHGDWLVTAIHPGVRHVDCPINVAKQINSHWLVGCSANCLVAFLCHQPCYSVNVDTVCQKKQIDNQKSDKSWTVGKKITPCKKIGFPIKIGKITSLEISLTPMHLLHLRWGSLTPSSFYSF